MAEAAESEVLGGGDEKARARARVGLTVNNKFRLDALLGVGGMASVYACTHRNGARKALKILHTEFARDQAITERFLREGYVANKVDHRGRVAIEDDGITEAGEPFLVMELLEGETAQQLWKRKNRKVPIDEGLWIAAELLDVLAGFHAQGIVHRDLKPANVFITKENVVKLLDFGVARMREAGAEATRAGTALGTPSFMAPEQAQGLPGGVDGRADIFSIGATLYAMLSGQRLHQGRSDNEAFILAATTPAPSVARVAPDLPVEVISLIDKALAWDKRNRFENAEAMRDECLRLMEKLGNGPARKPGDQGQSAARKILEEKARKAEQSATAAAKPIVEEQKEETLEDVDADDQGVKNLVDVFRTWERLLPTIRHYGWAHPETDGKLRATFGKIIEALRADPNAVWWSLSPYAFVYRGQTIWEPAAPLDIVPYNLFAAGIRKLHISTGFSEDELRSLCEVLILDPAVDLAPEDDLAAALWEKRLEHVRYDAINVFAEGDAADREAFWAEADDMEEMAQRAATEEKANRAEAAAMVIETDQAALRAARQAASVLALDPVTKKALSNQLGMSAERWSERFIDVITDAFQNAKRYRDLTLVTDPLDSSTRDFILQRRFDLAFSTFDAIARSIEAYASKADAPVLKAELARGMFSPETLRMLVREALRTPPPGVQAEPFAPIDLDQLAHEIIPVVNAFGPTYLETIFDLVPSIPHEGLKRTFFAYLERSLPGREAEVVDRIMTLDLENARPIMRILQSVRKPSAIEALRKLTGCANPNLRCEAIALLSASPEHLKDELGQLAESPQPELRVAALRALAYHQCKPAGPLLVRRMQEAGFHKLGLDERREMLHALYQLHPVRAEAICIEMLGKHGVFSTEESIEQTRVLAAEFLGRETRSMEALQAVIAAGKRRPWNSQGLRDKATASAEAIAARMGKRLTESGDVQ
ncbi:serine/threonine protein kinase [Minicystis rosea]|nr:serine/threonine protein kinase [Minicystis rosea]